MSDPKIYYLISQESPTEGQMMTYAQNVLQKLEFVCIDHINNLFEVVQVHHDIKTSFVIIRILKNNGLGDAFHVGDSIELCGGMVAFATTDGKKIECHPTVIIEHSKITLFDDTNDH
jgi:hypothetical protein